ncbi:hypothetical protein C8R43DRAFT_992836 [Mycena crocata]|nr:hypothetical protein C8R43DRAFT_992836 [Mycena crocata]
MLLRLRTDHIIASGLRLISFCCGTVWAQYISITFQTVALRDGAQIQLEVPLRSSIFRAKFSNFYCVRRLPIARSSHFTIQTVVQT